MDGMDRFLALAGPGMFGASWWPLILTYILTFLVCGIPFGKIFARLFGKIDLQKVGSGNIGTTNALRWWPLILTYILTFLVCGIPFGKIFARLFGKIDLQKVGSGNIGTTNALRAGGPKVAVPTLLCDVLKGVFGVNIVRLAVANMVRIEPVDVLALNGGAGIGDTLLAIAGLVCLCGHIFSPYLHFKGGKGDTLLAIAGLVCLCGHIFSPYLHFKGGKGIATGVGVLFGLSWPFALLHLGIFMVVKVLRRAWVCCLVFPGPSPCCISGFSSWSWRSRVSCRSVPSSPFWLCLSRFPCILRAIA